MTDDNTEYFFITSLAGSPCLFSTSIKDPVAYRDGKGIKLIALADNTYKMDLNKKEKGYDKK